MANNTNNYLTIKQENFCNKQIECGNASEAYRYAYDAFKMKDTTVNRCAKELLDNPKITARLNELRERLQEKTDITKEQLLKELQTIKDTNILDYFEVAGNTLKLKDLKTMPIEQQKAIESLEETKFGIKLKLHNKTWSIERICKMLGFDAPTGVDLTTLGDKIDNKIQIEVIDSISKVENKENE